MAARLLIAPVSALALVGGGYWWGHTATDNAWQAKHAKALEAEHAETAKETKRADQAAANYLTEHLDQEDRYAALNATYQDLRRRVPLVVPGPVVVVTRSESPGPYPPGPDERSAPATAVDSSPVLTLAAVRVWNGALIHKLMIRRAREGHSAFDSEQQNDPVAGEDAPFAHSIQFWVNRLAEWVFYGAADPSLGRHGNSRDPSALGIGGYQRTTGILDVVEAKIKKRTPDRIISDIIDFQREYCCVVWGVESVQFQEFLRTELVKRSAQLGVPVPARGLLPIADKLLRIESLQPHMHNGLIRLHRSQTTLVDQFRHFPKADHDDGPDMVVMLWMLAVTGGVAAAAQGGTNKGSQQSARERYGHTAQRMFRRG